MSDIDLSTNRFLSDYRIKKFFIDSNDQRYELSISNIIGSHGQQAFYTIFKPVEHDHIIYMSGFTTSWNSAKKIFKDIVLHMSEKYNVNVEDYPELQSFISKI